MYFMIPSNTDLSDTSYRCVKVVGNQSYIEYNEGFIGDDWVEMTESMIRDVAPEWFIEDEVEDEPTQLDRIELAVRRSHQEIVDEAIDNYTLELMEAGVIV